MYLLFDIGGTNTRVALSLDKQDITQVEIRPTPVSFEQGIEVLKQAAFKLTQGENLEKIAGGIAGPLDQQKTKLLCSPHLNGWVNKPLKETLARVFNCEVFLENDAQLGGLGEAARGAGAGKKIIAYLTVGTGVGGTRIVDGKIDQNSLGFEPGHQIIIPGGLPCNCGGQGHLETYIGGSYLEKIYRQKAKNLTNKQIWDEVTKYLSIGLNNSIVFWSPDIVILGGSVAKKISLENLRAQLKKDMPIFPKHPEIVLAKLENKAGLYGALEFLICNF